ncbi:MAG: NAD(P)/FAD-dependent oxidoreductase [Bryobacteraceae bacterium]|nr:NAD(P)/FAD-dependent oxidoreductase [Bryobacteraceae bacterium]
MHEHTVVVVGAGFAGMAVAKRLGGAPCRVVVIDRQNHHTFQPLLYQVATGGLSAADICAPIRSVLAPYPNVEVRLGEVMSIDVAARTVLCGDVAIAYDTLVLAAGMKTQYFGNDSWEASAPGLKTISDATEMRRRVLLAFERAEVEEDEEARRSWLTFVIVGGGPTGVELAGALAEITRDTLRRDFRRIRPAESQILLLDAAPRLLTSFDAPMSDYALRRLIRMGVRSLVNHRVLTIDDGGVTAESEGIQRRIPSRTVLWAAGVKGSSLAGHLGVELDRMGRVPVAPDLSVPGRPEVFVLGDLARVELDGKPLPGVAQPALQAGRYAAKVIRARLEGKAAPPPFRYLDLGSLATIGRHAAVADLFGVQLKGYLAWLVWLFVHLMHLVDFQNRVVVLIRWAVSYLTFHRGARLIG